MVENLPDYISFIFILTVFLTVYIFYLAAKDSKTVLLVLFVWLIIQGVISFTKFYTLTNGFPPRFLLVTLPAIVFIIGCFTTSNGRKFIDSLDLQTLTWLHIVRIPVELVLLRLYLHGAIPKLMTFEGRNFDILSGITAPLIVYFGFTKKTLNSKWILIWNCTCLGLLLNIIVNAILSAPFPFQQFGFEQPNIAILYFPFIWLPCCVVPLVLFSHLATIRRLIKK